ncbi:MAG: SDR family oxidoreductase, partial [Deltaproteobacteria bacterium]|nr:SDR family oxidoreductase [Deltaproteobacteria bacterium]
MIKADLSNKVAIVTGGASGIGQASSRELSANGCKVVVADTNFVGATRTAEECSTLGPKAFAVQVDISNAADVRNLFQKALALHGQLDILVNNAGVVETSKAGEFHEEDWDRMLAINTKGTVFCCNEAINIMRPRNYGKIVNTGSISGKVGGIHSGAAYSASKAAIICYTKSLAKSVAPYNINVNCVAPGLVDTPMTADYPLSMLDSVPLKRKAT